MTLLEQLEASNRLYQSGYLHGYNAGRITGHSRGLTACLAETIRAYDTLTPEAFNDWINEARDAVAVEREHDA